METRHKDNFITRRREPKRFILWLCMASSSFVFTVLLITYLVRKVGSDWRNVTLPTVFLASTGVIVASSLTLHIANSAFRHERFTQYRLYLGTTLFLGTLFVVLQMLGWRQLMLKGIYLHTNPSGSFLFILSGLHLLHIVIGLIFLSIAFAEAMRRIPYVEAFVYSVNPPNLLKIKLFTLYWHFVDVLWLSIFLFLLVQHGM
ncbi:cytochrome c oxidase subunit 3 [Larkinella rosea]|uniref:Heme-copper oxidase subunit III n=1 Tax=Larkinella rosea TaxID=2025312 RepID=A0A3P1BU36_9BACT|nr:cytochrome c oxidase subunit 3 [Larkinella rosea]RRB04567.1 heme-copper oxidase subunit III [Larkinella rosea]